MATILVPRFSIGLHLRTKAEQIQAVVRRNGTLFVYVPDRSSALRPKPRTPYYVREVRELAAFRKDGRLVSVRTVDVLRDASAALAAKARRAREKKVAEIRALPPAERREAIRRLAQSA